MRHLSFLVPVVAVCGLVAFLVLRVFDTSSVHGAVGDPGGAGPARQAASAVPASPSPTRTATDLGQQAATKPTVSPTGDRAAASQVRHDLERRLRDSGPAPEAWAGALGGAVDQVLRAPELQAVLRNAPQVECFAEGCLATLVFASAADFDLHQQAIGEAAALERWPRVITGPERQPDGTVRNALVVFRPNTRDELAALEAKRAELHATIP